MSYKNFIKDVGIIGITQVLINLSAFLLLPIITKTLGAYEYGIWSQLFVTVSLLTPLALLGLSMAFVRFFSSKTNKKEISKGFFSIFFFVSGIAIVIVGLLFVFSESISLFLFDTDLYSTLIQITAILIIFGALNTIVMFYFRVYRQMLVYSGLAVFRSIGQMALTFFLIVYLDYGLSGIVFSAIFANFLPLVIALGIIIKQVGFSLPSFSEMPKYLRFSLPLAPNSLIRWITDSSDRYIVGYIMGATSVGIYSAAYGLGNLVYLFVMPIQMILYPQLVGLYDNGEIEEVKTYLSYSLKFFLLIAIPSVAGLTVLSKQILLLLTTAEFVKGSTVIPLIALSALFAGIFQIIINITLLYKKTKYNFWIQFFSATINIILNLILIPRIGIIGAAIATLFSFIVMSISAYFVSIKHLRFKIDFVFISKIIFSSLLMALIVFHLSNQINLILQVLTGMFIYFVFCYVFKIFNKQEISFFKSMMGLSHDSR